MDDIASWIWVLIPIVAILSGVGQRWIKMKERQIEVSGREVVERAAQYAAKTERLEQRVAVLERILTDRATGLSDEIERLRDRPLN